MQKAEKEEFSLFGYLAAIAGLTAFNTFAIIFPQWESLHRVPGKTVYPLLSVELLPHLAGLSVLSLMLFWFFALFRVRAFAAGGFAAGLLATTLAGGMVIAGAWENHRILEEGHWGITNLFEVSLFLVFTLGAIGWAKVWKMPVLGAFLAPLLLAGVGFALWLDRIGHSVPRELVPALKSYWLPWHVSANFIGYGAFMVAAAAGAMLLVRLHADKRGKQSFLPPAGQTLAAMDGAIHLGFPVFTVAIVLGCVWAYEAWGGYWSWDPKETWALIVWLNYAGYLHARRVGSLKPAIFGWWALAGFAITLFCYLGVNMLMSGLHSYGTLS